MDLLADDSCEKGQVVRSVIVIGAPGPDFDELLKGERLNQPYASSLGTVFNSNGYARCAVTTMASDVPAEILEKKIPNSEVLFLIPPSVPVCSTLAECLVAVTPEQKLVFTNHVYLSEEMFEELFPPSEANFEGQRNYVLVNSEYIYCAQPHPQMVSRNIGLSSIQREALRVELGAVTRVETCKPPRSGSHLVACYIQMEYLPLNSKQVTFGSSHLLLTLRKLLEGQVFCKGQVFCLSYMNKALKFKVALADVGNHYGDPHAFFSQHGVFTARTKTKVIIEPSNKNLTIEID